MVLSYFPTAGGLNLNVSSASALPETGIENQIVIISDETVTKYYWDTNQPDSPEDGAVWISIGNDGAAALEVDARKNFSCNLNAAKIYNSENANWMDCAGYIYLDEEWVRFSSAITPLGTLEETSWAEIRNASDSGLAQEYWSVGDEKTVVVGGETLSVRIAGFNHFAIDMANEEKRGIVFEFTEPLTGTESYNFGTSAVWADTSLRGTLNSTFLTSLPSELQEVIRECYPQYCNANGEVLCSADKIFVLSVEEYNRGTQFTFAAESAETEPLDYYLAGNAGPWASLTSGPSGMLWTRSIYSGDTTCTLVLSAGTGEVTTTTPNSRVAYLCPCFVV